jgi:hypothetical protein
MQCRGRIFARRDDGPQNRAQENHGTDLEGITHAVGHGLPAVPSLLTPACASIQGSRLATTAPTPMKKLCIDNPRAAATRGNWSATKRGTAPSRTLMLASSTHSSPPPSTAPTSAAWPARRATTAPRRQEVRPSRPSQFQVRSDM